ncbi:hypothetical protein [Comamonas composti]|uniref:hypothetical protein n=1 Tax=Comamonas composti TaxID=408558 RepID=UPI00047E7394|nr:hypothetical protein [Comamonas composti]
MSSAKPNPSQDNMASLVALRTLDKYERDYYPKRDRITIAFRGDLAERFNYDKIQPLSEAQRHDNQVVIQGKSQKTGETQHYCIECNSWSLIEVVGVWQTSQASAE